jgi:hypothetical protein
MEDTDIRNGKRIPNYGMAPRRFTPLGLHATKPPVSSAATKDDGPSRIALGARRALWIIAIATLINAGVAALQWYEIDKAYSPAKKVACLDSNCGD